MTVIELKTRPAAINEDVIARLEGILAEARDGKIVAVAIAGVEFDGTIISSWSESDRFGSLLGAVARLLHRLNANQAIE